MAIWSSLGLSGFRRKRWDIKTIRAAGYIAFFAKGVRSGAGGSAHAPYASDVDTRKQRTMNSSRCSKPWPSLLQARGYWRATATLTSVAALAACSASPSRNILGSYFPTWMICALLGLLGVVILRAVLGKAGIDSALPMPVVVYLCLWITLALAIWLLWLG